MNRKIFLLEVAALTGALGLATTPPLYGHDRDEVNRQQSPEIGAQTQSYDSRTEMMENQMSPQQVEEVQQALKQQGHVPGPIDGTLNPQTEAAIKSFQQSSGLEATGQLDDQTLAQLGINERPSGQNPVDKPNSLDPEGSFSS